MRRLKIDLSDPENALEQALEMLDATNTQLAAMMLVNKYLVTAVAELIGAPQSELRATMREAAKADLAQISDSSAAERIQAAVDLLLSETRTQAEILPFVRR